MKNIFIYSFKMLLVMTVITGLIYPLFITVVGQVFFPQQANGSLYIKNDIVIGSKLIGQNFQDKKYFHSRPSSINYNPMPSGASNLAITSLLLKEQVDSNRNNFKKLNSLDDSTSVPSEMIFASASGVDPHITLEAALLQVPRIIKARALNSLKSKLVYMLVDSLAGNRQFGIFGSEVVNVLDLNIKLDEQFE